MKSLCGRCHTSPLSTVMQTPGEAGQGKVVMRCAEGLGKADAEYCRAMPWVRHPMRLPPHHMSCLLHQVCKLSLDQGQHMRMSLSCSARPGVRCELRIANPQSKR